MNFPVRVPETQKLVHQLIRGLFLRPKPAADRKELRVLVRRLELLLLELLRLEPLLVEFVVVHLPLFLLREHLLELLLVLGHELGDSVRILAVVELLHLQVALCLGDLAAAAALGLFVILRGLILKELLRLELLSLLLLRLRPTLGLGLALAQIRVLQVINKDLPLARRPYRTRRRALPSRLGLLQASQGGSLLRHSFSNLAFAGFKSWPTQTLPNNNPRSNIF